jgi:hypothetical protein
MIKEPFRVGRPIFWHLSEYYFSDKSDYSMDVSKVLGVPERKLGKQEDLFLDDYAPPEEPKIVKRPRDDEH